MSFFQKIFKIRNFTYKVMELFRKSLMRSFKPIIYCVKGITLVEAVIISVLIAGVAFGATYFLAHNRSISLSSSQTMGCQEIAKQALDSVVSLGGRLYGYKINHDNGDKLSYNPVWLRGDNDIILGEFPPPMYRSLFKKIGVSYTASDTPEDNSKVRLIKRVNPSLIKISTAVLLINFVNALQYLYNSNPSGYTSTHGVPITMSDLETLKSYKKKFDLEDADIQFYMKISPVDLTTNMELDTNVKCKKTQHNGSDYVISDYSCPTRGGRLIVTRPRFRNPDNMPVLSNVQIVGNPDIGFELKVLVKYALNGQEYSCEGMHLFSHQAKSIIDSGNNSYEPPFPVTASNLKSGADVDLTVDPFVSCDTDTGGDYRDISLDLNLVNNSKHKQAGTFILCQMNSYCKSEGDGNHGTCSPVEGRWQMCEHIEPISGQSWTFRVSGNTLYFDDMQTDRRYELNVGEFSMAAYKAREKVLAKFYLDATRPAIGQRRIRFSNAVGVPSDRGEGGRNYSLGRTTSWATPPNSTGKWIQCNKEPVHFQAEITDQFVHNIRGCSKKVTRQDGSGGPEDISANTKCIHPQWTACCDKDGNPYCDSPPDPGGIGGKKCGGVLGEANGDVQHGRHTVTFKPSDSCGAASNYSGDLVWDTDIPNTFKPQEFKFSQPDNIKWLKSANSPKYSIETVVPAIAGAGKFPKHYSVDCDENYTGAKQRDGANNAPLKCELKSSSDDNGCNPADLGVKYYHVCGGGGDSGACKKAKWAVHAPLRASCLNVPCDPDNLLCCQDAQYCSLNRCLDKITDPSCSTPLHGSDQDPASGCANLGLYECTYSLECGGGEQGNCSGLRRSGEGCEYQVCSPNPCGPPDRWGRRPMCPSCDPPIGGTCSGSGGCSERSQPYNPSNETCFPRNYSAC